MRSGDTSHVSEKLPTLKAHERARFPPAHCSRASRTQRNARAGAKRDEHGCDAVRIKNRFSAIRGRRLKHTALRYLQSHLVTEPITLEARAALNTACVGLLDLSSTEIRLGHSRRVKPSDNTQRQRSPTRHGWPSPR
jgi:hypothetical protein